MNMKKITRTMSIYMGITLSFFLSLTGNLASGHFAVPGFLISLVASIIISLIIGFCVPLKKISDGICGKMGLKPGKIGTRCVESLISDIIYTPIITLVMVFLAYKMATSHGAHIPFLPMFLKSLLLSMVVGFVLIFIFTPIYLKLVMKKNGVSGPPTGKPSDQQ